MQYPLRSLFVMVLFAAIATSFVQFMAARIPSAIFIALFLSFILALAGLAIVAFAVLISFSVLVSKSDENRQYNLTRCFQLFLIGLGTFVPMLILFLLLRLSG